VTRRFREIADAVIQGVRRSAALQRTMRYHSGWFPRFKLGQIFCLLGPNGAGASRAWCFEMRVFCSRATEYGLPRLRISQPGSLGSERRQELTATSGRLTSTVGELTTTVANSNVTMSVWYFKHSGVLPDRRETMVEHGHVQVCHCGILLPVFRLP
jgi:hypothetical protein